MSQRPTGGTGGEGASGVDGTANRSLLALTAAEVGDRHKLSPSVPPVVRGPGARRQGERLSHSSVLWSKLSTVAGRN